MIYHKYNKKLNGTIQECAKCEIIPLDPDTGKGIAIQHHIGKKTYSDICIWLCNNCHQYVHRKSQESYDKGFLVRKGVELERLNSLSIN